MHRDEERTIQEKQLPHWNCGRSRIKSNRIRKFMFSASYRKKRSVM